MKLLRTRRSLRCAKPQVPGQSRCMPNCGLALEGNWNLFKEHGSLAPQSVAQSAGMNCFCCGNALQSFPSPLSCSYLLLPAHVAPECRAACEICRTPCASPTRGVVFRIEFLNAICEKTTSILR
jgi:hypothetical protein